MTKFNGASLPGPKHRQHSAGMKKMALLTAHTRMIAVMGLFALGAGSMFVRIGYIGLVDAGAAYAGSGSNFMPPRADILDRNGEPMARNIEMLSLRVVPSKLINDRRVLANGLAAVFPDTSADDFYAKLGRSSPFLLRGQITPREANLLHALGEIGFEYPAEEERFYPETNLASHVLGYTNIEKGDGPRPKGRMGMEKTLDKELTDPALHGDPQYLSIDLRAQAALESELGNGMTRTGAEGAAGIVLDVHTGEVLAMASLPDFDPNVLDGKVAKNSRNNVTYTPYELGSTFKPLTVAAALDAGVVTNLATRYDATGPILIGGHKIRDIHSQGRWLNVPELLVHSSNVATARIADKLGRAPIEAMFRKLHFDKPAPIDLTEAGAPQWPRDWGRVTNMTVSYGHGIGVTPVHLATAYAALVNGGIWRPATLRKVEPGSEAKGTRVFKAATSARINQLLRMIVVDGTGKSADAPGFRVGGKTGSADKPKDGGYDRNAVVATFAAAFPMDNPQYVILVMLDNPKANAATSFQRTAAYTAGPVIARLVPRIGPVLGVMPDMHRDVDVSELMPLLWKAKGERE